ncbi:MAG: pirin family protein [Proteobacteria bacterium]|nr:pirin family protein [Pseudomonadota bacterium]
MESRRIARIDGLTTLHEDAIRLGRAAIMPGQWARHDPFLSMMNDRFGRGAFGPHPHRGFETLTYVISGRLRHEDNQGGGGTLGPGDAQWMTAGRGVVHNELPEGDAPVHVLQLWINLPQARKLAPFRYQDLRGAAMPVRREPGAEVRVFAGASGGVQGPAQTHTPLTMLDIRMAAGARLTQVLPGGHNGFVYVLQGAGRFGADAQAGRQDQTLWLDRLPNAGDTRLAIEATEPLHLLLFAGAPLQEPVVAYGPFVMNTEADIAQAIADYQRGEFAPA